MQIREGSETAFTELFHRYKYRLFGFMYKLTESAEMAEDIVQEVFTSLWKNHESLAEIENLDAFIFRMARNQAINAFRRMARETLVLSELKQAIPSPISAEQVLEARDLERTLRTLVDQLPPQQRLVFTLSREQGLKHNEIALQLNISPGTVKNHMIQALRTLRRHLDEYPQHPSLIVWFIAIATAFEK